MSALLQKQTWFSTIVMSALSCRGDSTKLVADLDRRKPQQAFNRDMALVNRFMTAQSTMATRRCGVPAIVTLAAIATLAALTADAAVRQARPVPATEATAPRDAREPIMAIMAIVSIGEPAGHLLRRRRLDPARAGVDLHHRT